MAGALVRPAPPGLGADAAGLSSTAARIGQAGRGQSRLAGGLPPSQAGAVSVYTLGALVALLVHLDRLRRMVRGGRRSQPAAHRLATAHSGKVRDPN
jgi:hypothetical protein